MVEGAVPTNPPRQAVETSFAELYARLVSDLDREARWECVKVVRDEAEDQWYWAADLPAGADEVVGPLPSVAACLEGCESVRVAVPGLVIGAPWPLSHSLGSPPT